MGFSVTKRIAKISQPRGGYIKPSEMDVISLPIENELKDDNISAALVGLAVDYLTRYMMSKDVKTSFKISFMGAYIINDIENAEHLAKQICGLDNKSIIAACKLVGYDVCFRANVMAYKPVKDINPDANTIYNIKELVERSLVFFKQYGPIVKDGFTFEGGYTDTINSGDGDFLTKDTIWDFKVSQSLPTNKHTLQLLVYYLMGKHSIYKEFQSIKYIAIFNPKLNKIFKYNLDNLSAEIINTVEKDVIGY